MKRNLNNTVLSTRTIDSIFYDLSVFNLTSYSGAKALSDQVINDLESVLVKHGLVSSCGMEDSTSPEFCLYDIFVIRDEAGDLVISPDDIKKFLQDKKLLEVLDPWGMTSSYSTDDDAVTHAWNRLTTAYICLRSGFDTVTPSICFDKEASSVRDAFNSYITGVCEALVALYNGRFSSVLISNFGTENSTSPWSDPSRFVLRQLVKFLNHVTESKSEYIIRTFPVVCKGYSTIESASFYIGSRRREITMIWSDVPLCTVIDDVTQAHAITDDNWIKARLNLLYSQLKRL